MSKPAYIPMEYNQHVGAGSWPRKNTRQPQYLVFFIENNDVIFTIDHSQ